VSREGGSHGVWRAAVGDTAVGQRQAQSCVPARDGGRVARGCAGQEEGLFGVRVAVGVAQRVEQDGAEQGVAIAAPFAGADGADQALGVEGARAQLAGCANAPTRSVAAILILIC
jgi:hypothetical protein